MQYYIGTKQVQAEPQTRGDKPGYRVRYPDGYESWSPADAFEKAYFPQLAYILPADSPAHESGSAVTQKMVDDFISQWSATTIDTKTTMVHAILKNGFVVMAASSCVDSANYDLIVGTDICLAKIKDKVWELLGFTLQWARGGLQG